MMLALDHVTVRYPGAPRPVLDAVSLTVPAGVRVGLRAPSGSGKTTLLRTAALLLPAEAGSVRIDGAAVRGVRHRVPRSVRRQIGVVFQSPRASTDGRLTLRQIIAAPLSHDRGLLRPRAGAHAERIARLAEQVQLSADLLDRLPHQVSDGQLQRACLARAVALEPKVLICDEPTAMLDAPTTAVIMRLLGDQAQRGAAVLIASHDRGLLDVACDACHDLRELGGGTAHLVSPGRGDRPDSVGH